MDESIGESIRRCHRVAVQGSCARRRTACAMSPARNTQRCVLAPPLAVSTCRGAQASALRCPGWSV